MWRSISRSSKMRKLTIVLPFKLPTWNQLLGMDHWQRKEVRDWIHQYVSRAIREANGLETATEGVLKPSWTPLLEAEYYQLIRTNASVRYSLRKKLEKKIKQSSR